MSADPVSSSVSFKLKGDIATGKGQLGLTAQVVDTSVATINQVPSALYSDYFSHYLFNISSGNNADFVLAAIGTELVVGYTAEIDCLDDPSGLIANTLTIRASDNSIIAQLSPGGKIFLTAYGSPNTWKTAYGIPKGSNNLLLVYTGQYPQVRTLPIQKEFYFDGSFQYGIKCIQSYDFAEPATLANLSNYDNLNRIIFEGCSAITTVGLAVIDGPIVNSFISSSGITYTASKGSSVSSAIACYGGRGFTGLANGKGIFIAGCNNALVDNTSGGLTYPFNTCGALHSTTATINSTGGGTITNSNVIASGTSSITNQSAADVTVNCTVLGSAASTVIGSKQSSNLSSNGGGISKMSNSSIIASLNGIISDVTNATDSYNNVLMATDNSIINRFGGTGVRNSSIISSIDSSIDLLIASTTTNTSIIACNNSSIPSGTESSVLSSINSRVSGSTRSGVSNCFNGTVNQSTTCGVSNSTNSSLGNTSASTNSGIINTNSCTVNASTNSCVNASTGSSVATCLQSTVDSSTNCGVGLSTSAAIDSSFGSTINNSLYTSLHNAYNSVAINTTTSAYLNCDTCTNSITGDSVVTRGATGYNNSRAGVTLISSYGLPAVTSASSLRYCVIGGVTTPTWSIDSKTGQYYGSGVFNPGTPLPGFAEMYENLVQEVIPYGRLLQLENGKVRLAQNGESGFMICRPYESAAFVAGNPKLSWPSKFELDIYGLPVIADYKRDEYVAAMKTIGSYSEQLEADLDELFATSDTIAAKKVNSNYDLTQTYLSRSDRRDQWTTCEKSGIVVAEYTGQISIGDFLISAADGVAKRSNRKTNIRVIEIIDYDGASSLGHAKVDVANQNVASYVDDVTCKIVKDAQIVAKSLPVDISIKDIVFADDSFSVAAESRIKVCVSLIGDYLLASDVAIALIGKNNSYDLLTTYSKLRSQYVVNAVYRGTVLPDTYQIVFVTNKTLPAECKFSLKI